MKRYAMLLVSVALLIACGQTKKESNSSSSSSTEVVSSESTTTSESSTEMSSSSVEKAPAMNLEAIQAGDYSSILGTWENEQGISYTFDETGLTGDFRLKESDKKLENGRLIVFTEPVNSPYGGPAITFVPAGVDMTNATATDPSDKSQDRLYVSQYPGLETNMFFYRKGTETQTQVGQTSVTDAESTEFPGFSQKEVEAARLWLAKFGPYQKSIYLTKESPAGSPITTYSPYSKAYPTVTRGIVGQITADGSLTYSSNGDGTVTLYPTPAHWHQTGEQFQDKAYMEQLTQEILDKAETFTVPSGDSSQVQTILNNMKKE